MEFIRARKEHIDGIIFLLEKYHKDNLSAEEQKNGFVSARLSPQKLEQLFDEGNAAIVAVEKDKVVGVVLVGPWESWLSVPMFAHMAAGLPENRLDGTALTIKNSCLYGPVCLDLSIRGSGSFERLFEESRRALADDYPYMVAFIAKSNPRSYAAHTKKTALEVTGGFEFGGESYYYLACPTKNA